MLKAAIQRQLAMLQSPFTRKVGGMMVYTVIAQSVFLLTGPLIGRIFSPAEFGVYGLFYTFFTTAVGLIFLNFDFAIPAAADDDDAHKLTIGAGAIALVLAPVAGGVVAVMSYADLAGFGNLPMWSSFLMVGALLCQAGAQLLQNWSVRSNDPILIGRSGVTLSVVRGVVQIAFGWLSPFWWALALGEVLGRIGNAMHLVQGRKIALRSLRRRQYSTGEIKSTLIKYKQFPLVLLPSQTLDSAITFVQSSALLYFFGPSSFGIYFLMRRTLDLPVAFAFRSLSDIFYARQAEDARTAPERVRPFFVRSAVILALAGLAGGIPVAFVSPALFALIFGPEWREAGVLAAIMMPAAVANLAIAPVSRVFALTTRPRLRFCSSIVSLLGTLAVLPLIQLASLDLFWTTASLSAVSVASYIVYFIAGYIASGNLNGRPRQSGASS